MTSEQTTILPPRFKAKSMPDEGVVEIVDNQTRRTARVKLVAYGPVSEALAALFGDAERRKEPSRLRTKPKAVEPKAAPATPAAEIQAPHAAPPAAEVAPPKKKLFGAALRSSEERARRADEAQATKAPGAPVASPQAAPPAPELPKAEPSTVERVSAKPPEVPATKSKQRTSAEVARTKTTTAAVAGDAPTSLERRIDRDTYHLELDHYPDNDQWGYRIVVGGDTVAWIRIDNEKSFVLSDPGRNRFKESAHRNVMGAMARYEAVLSRVLMAA